MSCTVKMNLMDYFKFKKGDPVKFTNSGSADFFKKGRISDRSKEEHSMGKVYIVKPEMGGHELRFYEHLLILDKNALIRDRLKSS